LGLGRGAGIIRQALQALRPLALLGNIGCHRSILG
jgi:hypothetical protein